MKTTAVLLAAGASTRMGQNKLAMRLGGISVMERSANAFIAAGITDVVIAVCDATREEAARLCEKHGFKMVSGGDSRGGSVLRALESIECDVVLIHDCARCLVTPEIILDSIACAKEYGSGVAALSARDTVRDTELGMLDRSRITLAQTPQTFRFERILAAYKKARDDGFEATDDCAVYERMWGKAHFSKGSITNQKLTSKEDMEFFEAMAKELRTGYGEDTHRLTAGRDLVLCGVTLPYPLGLLGHSDADAATHAVIDALLGAAAMGDIGRMFPDSDAQYKGISSLVLLERAWRAISSEGWALGNIDVTIIAQEPKLAPHIELMRQNLARALCCGVEKISVKATTPEHTGPEGNLECISARSVCTIVR